jgi:hypothetical protein
MGGWIEAILQKGDPESFPKPTLTQNGTQGPALPIFTEPPSHNSDIVTVLTDTYYYNSNWEIQELYKTIRNINKTYHEEHPYSGDSLDVMEMAIDI